MKKTIALVFALSSVLFAQAGSAGAHPSETGARRRGTVEVTGRAIKAVTVGPANLHGYSGFAGGAIFVARAGSGTDADCAAALAAPGAARPTTLVADQVAQIQLGAGQVACLVTDTNRSFELLWHAFVPEASATVIASTK
jgi:hypothetical protein